LSSHADTAAAADDHPKVLAAELTSLICHARQHMGASIYRASQTLSTVS